jgi:hypothetical protein
LTKEPKTHTGEKIASSTNGASTMQKTETRSLLLILYKNQLQKCINDPKVRPETLKLPQEKIGKTLEDMSIRHCFLNRTPTVQEIKARIDKWDCIKLKVSAHHKKQ